MKRVYGFALAIGLLCMGSLRAADGPQGPIRVRPERFYPLLMPSGAVWGVSVQALAEGRLAVTAIESTDGGHTWSERRTLAELPKVNPPTTSWGDGVPLIDRRQTMHYFVLRWDASDEKARIKKLALWHLKADPPYDKWTEPKLWFDGYIGALLSAIEMPNGTILSPFAFMTERTYASPVDGLMKYIYMGEHTTTAVYSTDRGETFKLSPTPVNLPASIIIGGENGAIEPVCITLKDGRAWMLIRTQRGRQWESFSKDGISWSSPRPARFLSSDSPAGLTRLQDGRLVAMWNCCQRYPYAHGGRQVLHAAISSDDGNTWHGFREVMRDPKRLEPAHPIKGDYGTGYPIIAATSDGKMLFSTGQGPSTGSYTLDPAWLEATSQAEDFSKGLEAWSVYGTKGVDLVDAPDASGNKALRIERTDAEFPAGAVWNFPNGRAGTAMIGFQLTPGPGRTSITLTDHYSSPFETEGEANGLFTISLSADTTGPDGKPLGANGAHQLQLSWDTNGRTCVVWIDGQKWKQLPQLKAITEGASYLRFRSLADAPEKGGLIVSSIETNIEHAKAGLAPADVP